MNNERNLQLVSSLFDKKPTRRRSSIKDIIQENLDLIIKELGTQMESLTGVHDNVHDHPKIHKVPSPDKRQNRIPKYLDIIHIR